jgi:hypothetical protein
MVKEFSAECEEAAAAFYRYALDSDSSMGQRREAFEVARATVGSRLVPVYWETAEMALRRIMAG